MRRVLPLLALCLLSLYPLTRLKEPRRDTAEAAGEEPGSLLPTAASDVIIVAADFSGLRGDLLDPANLTILRQIDDSFAAMAGLRGYSSLLNANVVQASQDEILSLPFVPEDEAQLPLARQRYESSPEIWPYLSRDFRTAVFYLEPGFSTPTQPIIDGLEDLQRESHRRHRVQLDFTGLRPVRAYMERYLTRDLVKTLPVMFLLISLLYYLAFGNWQVLAAAWALKVGITGFAFAAYRLLERRISPMVILVPTFSFGLLSDYIIHVCYHLQGRSGTGPPPLVRKHLLVPLSVTAATSVVGFLSIIALGGDGHVLIAVTESVSIATVFFFALWWLPGVVGPHLQPVSAARPISRRFSRGTDRVFAQGFVWVYGHRRVILPVLFLMAAAAAASLFRLQVQPYPLRQFPASATVVRAERILNDGFSGTVPFRLEIEASGSEPFLQRENLRALEVVHEQLSGLPDVGFQHSILSVLERINYYFHDSDPRALAVPEAQDALAFSSLIQQYLLFYSASASPEEYESLIDAGFAAVAVHGILRYRDVGTLESFRRTMDRIVGAAPAGWTIRLSGPLLELMQIESRMKRNWRVTFAFGSALIFLAVLLFFRSLKMSLISLIPSLCILLVLAGVAPLLGIQVDEYTIVIVGISTGLTIDYTVHMLNTLRRTTGRTGSARRSVSSFGYALVRGGGQPVFLSFLTTVIAFSTLFVSAFTGAVHFAVLLCLAIGSAFLISVFVLPIFFVTRPGVPTKRKAEVPSG